MVVVPSRFWSFRISAAGLHAQGRVEVRERLVHQERGRLAHDRAPQRDALALAAGERLGLALEVVLEVERRRRVAEPAARSRPC